MIVILLHSIIKRNISKIAQNLISMDKNIIKREKPIWIAPINSDSEISLPKLRVFNSLTNQKEFFVPREGRRVEWYSCGPTVYDVSHMGHARTYVSVDILRRVLRNYLGFEVHYVMNITDIDDKIIKRARQAHLYERYVAEAGDSVGVREDVGAVLGRCDRLLEREKDGDVREMLSRERKAVAEYLDKEMGKESLITIKDSLSGWLDEQHGHTVTDNAIFESLPRKFEAMFHDDMRQLNILPPDELTRVSEYIPQIIDFITTIINRDLAYESHGSVYFDTEAFSKRDNHYYAKLVPSAYGNESLLQEGEGALSTVEVGEKKSNNDFALWKSSKKGEPSWPSPWGLGRPGWHIECSAMAGDKCGAHLDIHTGGVDLKFPHHDNELAQSEAHYGCAQWVNYFLHTGHLTISGCKMSKSLKNFISIKDALLRHSSRQLRLGFLLSSWKDTLDYSDDLMTSAIVYEKMLLDFFYNVHYINRLGDKWKQHSKYIKTDTKNTELATTLLESKEQFHNAICDSFDTRECMIVIKKLVEETTKHIKSTHHISSIDTQTITSAASYVYEIMKMFGAAEEGNRLDLVQYTEEELKTTSGRIVEVMNSFRDNLLQSSDDTNREIIEGFLAEFSNNTTTTVAKETQSHIDIEQLLAGVSTLRQRVRVVSRQNKWKAMLALCDGLRDRGLVSVGVRLQDTATVMEEGEEEPAIDLYPCWAAQEEVSDVSKKQQQQQEKKKKAGEGTVKVSMKVPNNVDSLLMFCVEPYKGQFSRYDDGGLPTHGSDGEELSKTRRSKLKKLQAEQDKKYKAYIGAK